MKKQYNNLYKTLEQFRINLIADLQPYSDELINTKPSAEAWSVADIIAHLIAREEYEFNYISNAIKNTNPAEKTGFKAKTKRMVLKIAFILPIKFKVPEVVAPATGYATLKELENKWEKISKASHELLNSLDESEFHKDIWKHPRVGKINFVQMTDFAIDHSIRHEKQIKKTIIAVKNKIKG